MKITIYIYIYVYIYIKKQKDPENKNLYIDLKSWLTVPKGQLSARQSFLILNAS